MKNTWNIVQIIGVQVYRIYIQAGVNFTFLIQIFRGYWEKCDKRQQIMASDVVQNINMHIYSKQMHMYVKFEVSQNILQD